MFDYLINDLEWLKSEAEKYESSMPVEYWNGKIAGYQDAIELLEEQKERYNSQN